MGVGTELSNRWAVNAHRLEELVRTCQGRTVKCEQEMEGPKNVQKLARLDDQTVENLPKVLCQGNILLVTRVTESDGQRNGNWNIIGLPLYRPWQGSDRQFSGQ